MDYRLPSTYPTLCSKKIHVPPKNKDTSLWNFKQTVYWIVAASKGWIKETYRKIMHTQNHITGNDLVQIE